MHVTNSRLLQLLLVATISGPLTGALAASFDCAKARQGIETLICGSPQVSKLDEDLAVAYRAALRASGDASAATAAQREWLKTSRDMCRTAECLTQAYTQRIEALTKMSQTAGADASAKADAVAVRLPAAPARTQSGEALPSGKPGEEPEWGRVTPAERAAFVSAWDELLAADEKHSHLRRVALAQRLADIAARVNHPALQVAMLGQLATEYRSSGQFELSRAALGRALAAVENITNEPKRSELLELLQESGRELDRLNETSILGIAFLPPRDQALVQRVGWGKLPEESERLFSQGLYDKAALLFFEADRSIGELGKTNGGRIPQDEWAASLAVASKSNGMLRIGSDLSDAENLKRARALIYLNSLRAEVDSSYEFKEIEKAVDFIGKLYPNTLDAAVAQEYLGKMAIKAGLYLDVYPPLERAIELRESVMGPNDPAIADDLILMAGYEKRRHRRWKVIEPMYARAYRIQVDVLGGQNPVTLQTLAMYDEATKQNRADKANAQAMVRQLERAFEPEPAIGQLRDAFLEFDGACRTRIGGQTAQALSQIRMLLGLNSPMQALAAKSLARSQLQIVRSVGCAPR